MEDMVTVSASRYHDFSCGHRVVGHEGKCALLHGHNYRIHFEVEGPELDAVGRVLDFSQINSMLCQWLEDNWDHRFLASRDDPVLSDLVRGIWSQPIADGKGNMTELASMLASSIVWVPFNPTAENMALHLLKVVGPSQLGGTGLRLRSVRIEETRKCSAAASFGASVVTYHD